MTYFSLFLPSKVVGKLKTVSVDSISKDTMKVRWRLDCSDRVGIVTGYRIKYCPLASPDDTADCVGRKELNITTGPDKDKVTITGLKPWTHYKVGVSVLTRAGESELSDYLVNRTRRDRPGSPPTELRSALLSRNEVRLTWGSPTIPNGPIESFEVRTNFTDFAGHLEATIMTIPAVTYALEDGSGFEIDIPDLQFNIEYGIGVRACVNMVDLEESVCGFEWAETKAKTGIGRKWRKILCFRCYLNLAIAPKF